MTTLQDFYKNKTILVTGHTGFKGSWMCEVLLECGATVYGYALAPKKNELFELCGLDEKMHSRIGDIRDYQFLEKVFDEAKPEIVIHMAAQPIVLESYNNPRDTYDINVMGTVNVLECVRKSSSVKSFVNVTTDKVYKNNEWIWGYRENEELDGYDPYSNSKSCSELVTACYKRSFFENSKVAVSTLRAGNVIGGGDFSDNRIIPDCVRAALMKKKIQVRNPSSVRPYQFVLEPVCTYLQVAMQQYQDKKYEGNYNVGPDDKDCVTTETLVTLFADKWGNELSWEKGENKGQHEANYLKLDCSKLKRTFNWKPRLNIEQAVEYTVEWTKRWDAGETVHNIMTEQIRRYLYE